MYPSYTTGENISRKVCCIKVFRHNNVYNNKMTCIYSVENTRIINECSRACSTIARICPTMQNIIGIIVLFNMQRCVDILFSSSL